MKRIRLKAFNEMNCILIANIILEMCFLIVKQLRLFIGDKIDNTVK